MSNYIGIAGIVAILAIAFAFSSNRRVALECALSDSASVTGSIG